MESDLSTAFRIDARGSGKCVAILHFRFFRFLKNPPTRPVQMATWPFELVGQRVYQDCQHCMDARKQKLCFVLFLGSGEGKEIAVLEVLFCSVF